MEVYLREYFEGWNRIYKGGINMFRKFFKGRTLRLITIGLLLAGLAVSSASAGLIFNNHKILVFFMATGDPRALQAREAAVEAVIHVREAFSSFLKGTGLYEQAELAKLLKDDAKMRLAHQQAVEAIGASLEELGQARQAYKRHEAIWQVIKADYEAGKLPPEGQRAFEAFLKAAAKIGWSIEADFAGYFDYLGRVKVLTEDVLSLLRITPPCFPITSPQQERLEAIARSTFKEWLQALSFIERVSALSVEASRMALRALGY